MKVFLTAGEASGDRLGADLIQSLKVLVPDVEIAGVGGPLMQEQGLSSLFDMSELSIMGLAEILPRYFALKRRIAETADAAIAFGADVVVNIDAPEFSSRVAKILKSKSDIPITHYVAPTVWAWRAGRAKKMARHTDHVLALFPFEPPYMTSAGMSCDFVGHPIVADPEITPDHTASLRSELGLSEQPVLVVLPGSRTSEVNRLLPVFRQVMEHPALSEMQMVIPTLPHLEKLVAEHVDQMKVKPTVFTQKGASAAEAAHDRRIAFSLGDAALAASGTVSLELASVETPMVIAYDMHWLSRQIIGRMLKIDTVTLVNLVAESRTVPEFIGSKCQPDLIANALSDVLTDPGDQLSAMQSTMLRLGKGQDHPGMRAARSILSRFRP